MNHRHQIPLISALAPWCVASPCKAVPIGWHLLHKLRRTGGEPTGHRKLGLRVPVVDPRGARRTFMRHSLGPSKGSRDMRTGARHSGRVGLAVYRLCLLLLFCLLSAATVPFIFGLLIAAGFALMLIGIVVGFAAKQRRWSDRGVIVSLCGAGLLFGPTLYVALSIR